MNITEVKPISPPTVEDYLNHVDYEFKGYMPTEEALRFVNFIKAVNGGQEENKTPIVHLVMMEKVFNGDRRCAIMVFRGAGKLEAASNKILTPKGWVAMEDLNVGDYVFNRNGKPVKIKFKTPPQTPDMYNVTFSNGTTIKFGDEHNHIIVNSRGNESVKTTKEMFEDGLFYDYTRKSTKDPKKVFKYKVPLCESVEYKETIVELDPYLMGYMLGDGNFKGKTITVHNNDLSTIKEHVLSLGYVLWEQQVPNSNTTRFRIKDLCTNLKETRGDKYIPEEYLRGSIPQRVGILRGLMDSDGTIGTNGSVRFNSNSLLLINGVKELVESLGGIATLQHVRKKENCSTNYTLRIKIKSFNPFKLPRKADRWKPAKIKTHSIVNIQPIEKETGYCISVDCPTESYITKDFIVTHNTTIFAEYLILYIAAFGYLPGFGDVNLMLYVTDSIENGVKNLRRNVEYRYQESEFLQHMIPNQSIKVGTEGAGYVGLDEYELQASGGRKFTDIRMEFMNHKGHRLVVKGYGALTGVRGAKEMGKRPQVAMLDDLLSDEGARSTTVIETIENTIYKAVSKALHPTKQKMIFIGTPFNANDPLYKAVESGAWTVSVFPICEKFPVSKEDFRGAWEDRFTYEYVKAEYDEAIALKKPENFNQELMLRIMSEEDRLIQNDDMIWFSRRKVLSNKDSYNFYITTDFATSAKKGADFSVISIWAYNNNGDWMLVDGVCKQQLMDQNIKDLFRYVSIYKPLSVGIEVTGQQGGFIRWITNEMVEKNTFFYLASSRNSGEPGIRPAADKLTRFNQVLPMFKQKKIWFAEELKDTEFGRELIDELSNVSKKGFKSKHDDVADTISMLSEIDAYKPSIEVSLTSEEFSVDSSIWSDFIEEDNTGNKSTIF